MGANGPSSADGLQPTKIEGDAATSVNLWGFQPAIWDLLESAMSESKVDESRAPDASGAATAKVEVLLPEAIAAMVARRADLPVRVVVTATRLVGVTHAADLPVVSSELTRQVAVGLRPSTLWTSLA